MKMKIYYHHTDCGGVVYYSRYLDFLEEARTNFLEKKGIFLNELRKQNTQFVVYRQEIDYKHPAFYADTLQIDTRLIKISRTRLEFTYDMQNQNQLIICTAKTTLACIGENFRPRAIPPDVVTKISQGLKNDN